MSKHGRRSANLSAIEISTDPLLIDLVQILGQGET